MDQHDDWELRQQVYIRFNVWRGEGKAVYIANSGFGSHHLTALCGRSTDNYFELSTLLWRLLGRGSRDYRPYFVPGDDLTEAEAQLCLALTSDNGWAIYKMLEARHKES